MALTRQLLSLAFLLGALFQLQGCGGSDATAEETPPSDDTTAPVVAKKVITSAATLEGLTLAQAQAAEKPIKTGIASSLSASVEDVTITGIEAVTSRRLQAPDCVDTAGGQADPTTCTWVSAGMQADPPTGTCSDLLAMLSSGGCAATCYGADAQTVVDMYTTADGTTDTHRLGTDETTDCLSDRLAQTSAATTAAPATESTQIKVTFTVTVEAAEADAITTALTTAQADSSAMATAIQTAIADAPDEDFTDATLVAEIRTAAASITVAALADPVATDATTATDAPTAGSTVAPATTATPTTAGGETDTTATDAPTTDPDAATTAAPAGTNSTESGDRRLSFAFATSDEPLIL